MSRQRLTPSKLKLKDDCSLKMCINHIMKKAKYIVSKDQQVYLCSKCAVQMVGKGFKVEEIPGLEEEYRREQINKFIASVNNSIPNLDKLMNALIAKRDDIQKYYEQQRDKVEKYHVQISQCLEDEKMKILQQLFTNYKCLSKQYDDSIQCLQMSRTETISMKNDIESNVDRILKQIQNEPFTEIMASYNKNLSLFTGKTEQIQKTPIEVLKVTLNEPINIAHLMTVQQLKTCLIKKNHQQQKQVNDSVYVSFENKEQFTQPKVGKPAQSQAKTPRQDFSVAPFEIKTEEFYEEGHSQMIERDDIENSYQMMILDNNSEEEEENKQNQEDLLKSFGPSVINKLSTPQPNNKLLVSKIIQRNNDRNYVLKGINTSLRLA